MIESMSVKAIVTDRHIQIEKYLREERPDIIHYTDPWHLMKSKSCIALCMRLSKLHGVAKKAGCELVAEWEKSIVNRRYRVGESTSEGKLS